MVTASLRPSLTDGSGSPEELLQSLAPQLHPPSIQVEVSGDQALSAGLDLVRRADFDPTQTLSIRSVAKSFAQVSFFFGLLSVSSYPCHLIYAASKTWTRLHFPAALGTVTQPRSTS